MARRHRDKAEAVRVYAAQAKDFEMEQWAAEIRLRAERRAGELLAEMKERGERVAGRPEKVSRETTLSDLGVTRDQSSDWLKLPAKVRDGGAAVPSVRSSAERNGGVHSRPPSLRL
jgi:hypothetical protein